MTGTNGHASEATSPVEAAVPSAEPSTGIDWEAAAKMAMQQRDRATQLANNLEIDLAIANNKIAVLRERAQNRLAATEV